MNNYRSHRAVPSSEMERIVADYKRSGLTQREYAQEHGLNLTTFRYWIYRRVKWRKPAAPALVEVQLPAAARATHYRLDFPGGKSLSFSGPVQQQELEQLCQLLAK